MSEQLTLHDYRTRVKFDLDAVCPETTSLFAKDSVKLPRTTKDFVVRKITFPLAQQLNQLWHSRVPIIEGFVQGMRELCCALEFEDRWFGCAIWSQPIAANRLHDAETAIELRRMALSPKCPRNTATWFLARMYPLIQDQYPKITRCISYQDTAVHHGTIYKAANWCPVAESTFVEWHNGSRPPTQTDANKIRWEYQLRKGM